MEGGGGEVIVLLPVINDWSRCEYARQAERLITHEGGAITAWVAKWPVSPDRDEYWPLERYNLSCKWIDKCIMIFIIEFFPCLSQHNPTVLKNFTVVKAFMIKPSMLLRMCPRIEVFLVLFGLHHIKLGSLFKPKERSR